MDAKIIEKAKEKLCEEIEAFAKKSTFTSGDLDVSEQFIDERKAALFSLIL